MVRAEQSCVRTFSLLVLGSTWSMLRSFTLENGSAEDEGLSCLCLLHSYLENNSCATSLCLAITYLITFSLSCSVSFAVVLTYLLCANRFYVGPFGKTFKVSKVCNFPHKMNLQLLCVYVLLWTSSTQTVFPASKTRDELAALNQYCSVAVRCSYLTANMFVPNSI